MPHVEITMVQGRSTEQKRRLVQRVTEAVMEEAGCTRDVVSISFVEVQADSFARAGLLFSDSQAKAAAERTRASGA